MIAEFSAAVSGIKTAFDFSKGISSLKTETEINQAVIEIQRILLEAQAAALEDKLTIARLHEELAALSKLVGSHDVWELEKDRYRLTQSVKGAFTYDLIMQQSNGEIFHRLCVTCFESGKKSVLQTLAANRGGELVKCLSCDKELLLADFDDPIVSVPRRNRFDGY